MNCPRLYQVICRACGNKPRKFSYRETAEIAAKVHAHEFGHRVIMRWWANYTPHDIVFTPKRAPVPASKQGDLFSGKG